MAVYQKIWHPCCPPSLMKTIAEPEKLEIGTSLPPGDRLGVSVHLPKWRDTVGWASREPRVLNAMKTGYPRFFIPRIVHQLAMHLLVKQQSEQLIPGAEQVGERLAILLDTVRHAQLCRKTLPEWGAPETERFSPADIGVYIVTWEGRITAVKEGENRLGQPPPSRNIGEDDIILVSYPAQLALQAKAFWQHTGFGISSRRAIHWLENARFLNPEVPKSIPSPEERFRSVSQALSALNERTAAGQSSPTLTVTPADVFLFPTGMTAITELADAIKSLRPRTPDAPYRVAVFGFLYVDTFKVLHRVLGYHPSLYKYTPTDLDALEAALTSPSAVTSPTATPHFDAVFTEFPGNPLLQSPDLARLHALSRRHNFVLVVDDTVGTYASLKLLHEADVVVTSLTKMFSGGCNVMGGSVTLNPDSPFHGRLRGMLEGKREEEERAWFWGDVLTMEKNSRDFEARVMKASRNAEVVVGLLRASCVVREVYYPLGGPTQDVYDRYRVEGGRYGFLLSIRFVSPARAVAFYDALDVAKGPSLGTNFTLCCAYTLLAHYKELEWAAEYGVVEDLVRISVGLEEREWLEKRVRRALRAAEDVVVEGEVCRGE